MADRIEKGRPISASTISDLIRNAKEEPERRAQTPPDSTAVKPLLSQEASGVIQGHNTEATAFDPFEIAIMDGSTLQTEPGERSLVVDIAQKSGSNSAAKMCVVIDRINPGEIGRVVAVGATWGKADSATAGNFATVADGARELTLGDSGEAVILAGSGNADVIVMLGGGGSGSTGSAIQWRAVHNEGSS